MNISRKKTVYKRFNVHRNLAGNSDINLHGDNFERVTALKYLGSALAETGELYAHMKHMGPIIQSGWTKLEEGIGGSM